MTFCGGRLLNHGPTLDGPRGPFIYPSDKSRAEVENQACNSRKSSPANLVFTAIYERGDGLADSRRCSCFPKVF